jgi:hypothetical protein
MLGRQRQSPPTSDRPTPNRLPPTANVAIGPDGQYLSPAERKEAEIIEPPRR